MCGIAGILKTKDHTDSARLREQLGRMGATLRHRGPDQQAVWAEGFVGLAHTRLSILDLTGGNQPMATADGQLRITFNGEIFNYIELREELMARGHRFATRSDTEVVLYAYREFGEECVHRFNGQWAFAIWDQPRHRLFLSRDRMGVRPVFWTQTAGSFLFASEIKALLASAEVVPELDLVALDQIFTFWVTLPPRTAIRRVQQLPPGHSMVVQEQQVRVWPFWKLEYEPEHGWGTASEHLAGAGGGRLGFGAVDCSCDPQEKRASEELLHLMRDATRLRLRSDVPVGAYLSGGIDSTFIAALTKSFVNRRLRTFSVGFVDPEFDESSHQREATALLQTENSHLRCGGADIARVFPEVVRHAEQPIIRTAPAPLFLLSRLVRQSIYKVVLTGEGADEILGGYDIFKEAKIRQFWRRQPDSTWRPLLLKRLYPYMQELQRQSPAYLKCFFQVGTNDLANPFFSHLPRWRLTAMLKRFYSGDVRAVLSNYDAVEELAGAMPPQYSKWPLFNQAEYLETRYLLPGYILSAQGDRMAMAHSVEARYPFLDHRVVEFAAKLSPRMKMKVLDQKHILKRASRGLIPESIRLRPKQPYRAPDGKCFVGPTAPEYAQELLEKGSIESRGIFEAAAVGALVDKFRRGQVIGTKDNMALVGILSTQLLLHQFATGLG